MKYVDCVITPDTSFMHIAEGLNKNLIGIYNQNYEITWETKNENSHIIFSKNKQSYDINTFDIVELIN